MDFASATLTSSLDTDMVNVNGSDDPFYRYKMQMIRVTYISVNGGTTVIDNAHRVAGDIYRDLPDLKSCFAKGLSGRVTVKDNKLYIPGRHIASELQRILTVYIDANVLCVRCGNPETVKHRKRERKCQACGKISSI